MLIKAEYNGEECLLNTDYIVDIFNADKFIVEAYTLDIDRDCYRITQAELQRWISEERSDT